MKVDDPRSISSQSVKPVSEPAAPGDRKTRSSALAAPDAVRLSSDLQLVDVAVRAAAQAGEVRPEAVARARALLDSGTLGADAERLADQLIDSLSEPIRD